MACVTLKRHLEFDPVHSPGNPSKRRRFACVPRSPKVPPTKSHQVAPSPFDEVLPKCTTDVISGKLHDEVRRMQRRRQLYYQHRYAVAGSSLLQQKLPSLSQASTSSSSPSPPASPPLSPSSSSTQQQPGAGGSTSHISSGVPLFTMKQVSMICEKMMKDREGELKEEYDKVLSMKLAEQYDAFMKFTYDEIQRRFQDSPMTYVS